MINNEPWEDLLETETDFSMVCEIYPSDQTPTVDGFDPADAVGLYAAVSGVTFAGQAYTRLVSSFGSVHRNISGEANSCEVEFSNVDRTISRFNFNTEFEGLIMVIRLISRASSTSLDLSQILFTGRCEKPDTGNKETLTVSATWILGGTTVLVPRRKYSKDDQEGRVASDPEFEGFIYVPKTTGSNYSVSVKRGGLAGLFGFKKTVNATLYFSTYSDLDANKDVPEVFGRVQLVGTHVGYDDAGPTLRILTAFCEGEINDLYSAASAHAVTTDSRLVLDATAYALNYGRVGTNQSIDLAWVAPGYYSRTAHIRAQVNGSTIDNVEPPPDVYAIIEGRLMTIPDGSGDWVTTGQYTDNGAAHARFMITSEDYWNLDPNWLADDEFYDTYIYNEQAIIDRSLTDFLFVVAG